MLLMQFTIVIFRLVNRNIHSRFSFAEMLSEKWRDFKAPLHNSTVVNSLGMTSWKLKNSNTCEEITCKIRKKKKFMSFPPSRCKFALLLFRSRSSLSLRGPKTKFARATISPYVQQANESKNYRNILFSKQFVNNCWTRNTEKKRLRNERKIWGNFSENLKEK